MRSRAASIGGELQIESSPHGTAVRLRETVKDVKVWVKDTDGKAVPGRMNLPEGWYVLPVSESDE